MNNGKYARKSLGFTLIEVMLAMAVFAIAGVALLNAAQNNFNNLSRLEQTTIANWVAANQLTAVSLNKTWPPKNNLKGSVEMAGGEWFWQQVVVRTTDKSMRAITIEVRQQERDEKPIASLTTYIAQAEK